MTIADRGTPNLPKPDESMSSVTDSGKLATSPDRLRAIGSAVERLCDNAPLRFTILAVLVLQLSTVVVFQPSYETNDDVFMTMIAAGKGLCPAPDEHLIFTNVIIGQGLKRLYSAYPGFPWYGCYLLLAHYAAQVAMLYCTLAIGRTPAHFGDTLAGAAPLLGLRWAKLPSGQFQLRWGLYLLDFGLVELPLLNRLQFTTTAFIASQAGIFLTLLAWHRRARQTNASVIGPLMGAVALLSLGGLVRLESLAMAVLVAIPLSLMVVREFSRRSMLPCGLAVASAALLISAAVAYDHWTYEHDPRWQGFRSFNQLRGQFHDGRWTYYAPETAPFFAQVGWSENDHAMIASWFSDDPVLYGKANLTRIIESYPWKAAHGAAGLSWQAFRSIARNRSVLSVVLVLPFVLAVAASGRRTTWSVGGSALAALAIIALVTWNKKVPPERVYFPLMSFPLSVVLFSFAWRGSTNSPGGSHNPVNYSLEFSRPLMFWQRAPRPIRVVVVLFVIGAVMGLYRQGRQSVYVHRARGNLLSFISQLRSSERKLYVSWEAALPYELVSPLDSLDSWRMPLLSLAWTQRTPWHEEVKQQFGISNVAQAMCQRDDIVLVATPLHRQLFATFAKEHFQAEVEFVPLMEVGNKFVAGQFRPREQLGNLSRNPTDGSRN